MTVDDVNLIESANEIMTRFFPTSNEENMASKSLFRQKTFIETTQSKSLSVSQRLLRGTDISQIFLKMRSFLQKKKPNKPHRLNKR